MGLGISELVKTFVSPQISLAGLDSRSAAGLIAAASDITLVLDAEGVIRDLVLQSDELAETLDDSATWIGRPVATTVAKDSRPKIELLLRDAAANVDADADAKWRHINHVASDGRSVPVLYCCVTAGESGRMVAFGRGLSAISALQQRLMNAQQSMERGYSRMREVEMRYRLLFQMSSEAVLIIDPAKQKVVEANPAASNLLRAGADDLVGRLLPELFKVESIGPVQGHLSAVRAGVRADDVKALLAQSGAEVLVKASLFRQDSATLFLVRIAATAAPANVPDVKAKLLKAVESAPDGFVVTDADGVVLTANAAFLEAAQLVGEEQARGKPLDRWIGESGVDLDVLIANVRQRGSVRFFSTTLRGEDGGLTEVEISAVAVRNGGHPSLGFAIRNVGARLQVETQVARKLPRPVEQLTELIGRVALKDLVSEATEVIERLCIEAALDLAGNNRASAAEMLGLSRQSLYVKLRRYGLGDLASAESH